MGQLGNKVRLPYYVRMANSCHSLTKKNSCDSPLGFPSNVGFLKYRNGIGNRIAKGGSMP
jgi:hypothetical protein